MTQARLLEITFYAIRFALCGALVVGLLRHGQRPARRQGQRRILDYSRALRFTTLGYTACTAFVVYAAWHAHPRQHLVAALVAGGFVLFALFWLYQVFFVHIAYDNNYIYYHSPLAGEHAIPWDDLLDIGFSRAIGSHYLVTSSVRRIWCFPMLQGYAELGEFLANRFPPTDQEEGT